jgi:hypothetical protein
MHGMLTVSCCYDLHYLRVFSVKWWDADLGLILENWTAWYLTSPGVLSSTGQLTCLVVNPPSWPPAESVGSLLAEQ